MLAELERQAESGDGNAACRLGDHYRECDADPENLNRALRWYRCGANLGDAYAQNNLGSMLLNGLACERDPTQAIQWYRQSAEQGNSEAQYNLAKRYLHGGGVNQDYAEARTWFEKAVVQGHAWAACELGTMYWLAQGVKRNLLAAADFHLIAAEKGDEVACRNLSEYRAELELMALSGSQMASLFLCRMSNRGFGADKSQAMTWAWISWAKKHCRPDTDPEISGEINEAYDFYRMGVSAENRRQGLKAFAGMRKALAKTAARGTGKRNTPAGPISEHDDVRLQRGT
jgi:TPR repeat protein